MLFNSENRGDFWYAILGCLFIAVIVGFVIAFFGSFWLGWFTTASLTLLGQSVLATFVICFVLAVFGGAEAVVFVGIFPLCLIYAMGAERKK